MAEENITWDVHMQLKPDIERGYVLIDEMRLQHLDRLRRSQHAILVPHYPLFVPCRGNNSLAPQLRDAEDGMSLRRRPAETN